MSSGHSCKHTCSFKHNKSKNWSYMMPWHCTLVFVIVLSLLLLVKIWGWILVQILKLDFGWNSEAEWWSKLVSQEHQSPHFHLKLSVRWIFQTRQIPRSPDGDDILRCDLKAVTFVEVLTLHLAPSPCVYVHFLEQLWQEPIYYCKMRRNSPGLPSPGEFLRILQ